MRATHAGFVRVLAPLSVLALLLPAGVSHGRPAAQPRPLCGVAPGAAAGGSGGVRVAAFNVMDSHESDGDRTLNQRLTAQMDQMAGSGVDVFGLQEVTESQKYGLVIAKLARGLSARTGQAWHWCYFRSYPHVPGMIDTRDGGGDPLSSIEANLANRPDKGWYSGDAILSRFPITSAIARRLPPEDGAKHVAEACPDLLRSPGCAEHLHDAIRTRAALWAAIATPYGKLSVITTQTNGQETQHLAVDEFARERQSSGAPTSVLLCDCRDTDAALGNLLLRALGWSDIWRALRGSAGPTATQALGTKLSTADERIDYVYLKSGATLRAVTANRFMMTPVVSGAYSSGSLWPSNHYGVSVLLAPRAA